MDFLKDDIFLKKLYALSSDTLYSKVIIMNRQEELIEEITGRVTSGSINIDGSSTCRRSCNLTILPLDNVYDNTLTVDDKFKWYNTKFQLKIGLLNEIDDTYPEICWFNQGIYVTTGFSISSSVNNRTLSVLGRDKMCLLDGTLGGLFFAATLLNSIKDVRLQIADDTGVGYESIVMPIVDVIYYCLTVYGGEQPHNIVINDVTKYGLSKVTWQGSGNAYIIYDSTDLPISVVFSQPSSSELEEGQYYETIVGKDDENYAETAIGYRPETLKYTKEGCTVDEALTAGVGDNVASILTLIKNYLGDYEYFYDVNGKFIFLKKKTYTAASVGALVYDDIGGALNPTVLNSAELSDTVYNFTDGSRFISIQSTPSIDKIRNDYSIWGTLRGTNDTYIHLRYAIDEKPSSYKTHDGLTYTASQDGSYYKNGNNISCDWREVLYQMSLDYYKYFLPGADDFDSDFINTISGYNEGLVINGKTGYEQYYADLAAFWRRLYDPSKRANGTYNSDCWNLEVFNSPQSLTFWFDFLDGSTELEIFKYSVRNIGQRLYTLAAGSNTQNVDGIFYADLPYVVFYDESLEDFVDSNTNEIKDDIKVSLSGYEYIYHDMDDFGSGSGTYSALDVLNDALYLNAYIPETVSVTALPLFHLEPNTRISIMDKESGVDGEYIINRMSLLLQYNGTMSISASKVPNRIV